MVGLHKDIPAFYFPRGRQRNSAEHEQRQQKIMTSVKQVFGMQHSLSEHDFVSVTRACGLPRYLNAAFFRRLTLLGACPEKHREDDELDLTLSYHDFTVGWQALSHHLHDNDSLYFHILRKAHCNYLTPEDFLPVVEDIVIDHPSIRLLAGNILFQERYIETVICRLYYDAKCPKGRMTLAQFRQCRFSAMINAIHPYMDLNNTQDCFSYKHFYVLYCKFWALDLDRDLRVSKSDLESYNQGALGQRVIQSIMQRGRIAAFPGDCLLYDDESMGKRRDEGEPKGESNVHDTKGVKTPSLSYLDFIWFLLSEVDKSTPAAIEYWFRCLDDDNDGILSAYELSHYWKDQEERQRSCGGHSDDSISFENIMRQMNDVVNPAEPGIFRLSDLKRDRCATERFFDTFINLDRFHLHESHQGSFVRSRRLQDIPADQVTAIKDNVPVSLLSDWCTFAEVEFYQLLLHEQVKDWDEEDVYSDEEEEATVPETEPLEQPGMCQDVTEEEKATVLTPINAVECPMNPNAVADKDLDDEDALSWSSFQKYPEFDSDASAPSTPITVLHDVDPSMLWCMDNTLKTSPSWKQLSPGSLSGTNELTARQVSSEGDDDDEGPLSDCIWWLGRQKLAEPLTD